MRETKRELIDSERKYHQEVLGSRGGIWKGDILTAEVEELEKLDASEIYPSRLNAKEVLITHKDKEFVFPVADGSAKLPQRDYEFQEPTLRREPTVRRENLSGESQGDREEFQPEETEDDAEARKDFWSTQGDFIYRHPIEPRVQLYVPREELFPIPLKLHWCHQVNSYRFGRSTRKTN